MKIWNLKNVLNLIHFGLIHLRIYKIFHILTSVIGENLQISLSVSQSQKQVIWKFFLSEHYSDTTFSLSFSPIIWGKTT